MKKPLFIIAILAIVLTSCNGCAPDRQVSSYETRYSENGDSTVYVHYVDNSGYDRSFFMDYVLFNSLYSTGGYGSCYGYYNSHPSYFHTPYYNRYNNYRSRAVNHYHYNNPVYNRSSNYRSSSAPSPSRPVYNRAASAPSRTYTPSRSYNTPNRSSYTPSRSYSSPSRSFSRGSSSRH